MAYTVNFPTSGSQPPIDDVATWLTENAEPFTQEGPETLTLLAVPVTIVFREDSPLRAHVEVPASVKLDRMVEVLYDLALLIGADVCLADSGKVTRGELWMRLADVQDCKRVAEALRRADAMGRLANISRAMWGVLVASMPGRDVRWDTQRECVVELLEVGVEGGISIAEAAWHAEDPVAGDVIARPVTAGHPHLILWRWLQEAHPSVANA